MEDTCKSSAVCYTVGSKLSEDEELSKLAQKRKEAKLSQSQLALMVQMPLKSLQSFEIGRRDINKCAAVTVYNLAQALGCKMEDLLELEEGN